MSEEGKVGEGRVIEFGFEKIHMEKGDILIIKVNRDAPKNVVEDIVKNIKEMDIGEGTYYIVVPDTFDIGKLEYNTMVAMRDLLEKQIRIKDTQTDNQTEGS